MSRRRWRKESDESFSLWYSVSRNGRTSSRRNTSNFKLIGNEGRKDWRQVLLSSIYEILLRYSSVSLDFVFIIRRDLFIRVMSRNKIGNIRILTSPYIYIYIYRYKLKVISKIETVRVRSRMRNLRRVTRDSIRDTEGKIQSIVPFPSRFDSTRNSLLFRFRF